MSVSTLVQIKITIQIQVIKMCYNGGSLFLAGWKVTNSNRSLKQPLMC